jgi:hypothetical protein
MALVIHRTIKDGKPMLIFTDLLKKHGDYQVGRWAKAPDVPDRCKMCPLKDVKPAVGFLTDVEGWRYGHCAKHKQKLKRYMQAIAGDRKGKE